MMTGLWVSAASMPNRIPGLDYYPVVLSPNESAGLIEHIDAQPWDNELRRRVQHFGYRYSYKSRQTGVERAEPLPDSLNIIVNRLIEMRLFDAVPQQAIINEYQPGQGITAHTDARCFGDKIVSLSLLSPCLMLFTDRHSAARLELDLAPSSLLVLTGAARYEWRHGIAARKSDCIAAQKRRRARRISVTFRNVTSSKKS